MTNEQKPKIASAHAITRRRFLQLFGSAGPGIFQEWSMVLHGIPSYQIGNDPQSHRKLPISLLIGDFGLRVEKYTVFPPEDSFDFTEQQVSGISGIAWAEFDCDGVFIPQLDANSNPLNWIDISLEVVATVANPRTEVSLANAQLLQPDIKIGDNLTIRTPVTQDELSALAMGTVNVVESPRQKRLEIPVIFENVTIEAVNRLANVGRIVAGNATFTPDQPNTSFAEGSDSIASARLFVGGFTLAINSMVFTPTLATADIILQLPPSISSVDNCNPASIVLGNISITPKCELSQYRPDEDFGSWIIGDTGMVLNGTGYQIDFRPSSQQRGAGVSQVFLRTAEASGSALTPTDSNTGYFAGRYSLSGGIISGNGLDGQLILAEKHSFTSTNPIGYTINIDNGMLIISNSSVISGRFGPGSLTFPADVICKTVPTNKVSAVFAELVVQADLDLMGEVDFEVGTQVAWGELTHTGNQDVVWMIEVQKGFLYLPAGPTLAYCPDNGSEFTQLPYGTDLSITALKSLGVAGVTIYRFGIENTVYWGVYDDSTLWIYSPDRPGGEIQALEIKIYNGYLHIGGHGVSGSLQVNAQSAKAELGNTARIGYVGRSSFDATLLYEDKNSILVRFVDSAVYDSDLDGYVTIPEPCRIDMLEFSRMQFTSTANLVGGDVVLPPDGVTLDYWQLKLVPTKTQGQAGVLSVRTGRIVFTAAGISEPIHFTHPFALTWGDMLADGNIGELHLDYRTFGQRFDKFPLSPYRIALSQYIPGATNGYLAVGGTVHFDFFGNHYVNIQDARHNDPTPPYEGRFVTIPKPGEISETVTDLHLYRDWGDWKQDTQNGGVIAVFDFPDVSMDYNVTSQVGFIGAGSTALSYIEGGKLDAAIELHADGIDIRLASKMVQNVNLGLYARLGGIRETAGCIRIEGPLLRVISSYSLLEASVDTGEGILSPRAGSVVEVNMTTTPGTFDFFAIGDMFLSVAGSAVDVSASVHLGFDFEKTSAEGELFGQIDCNSIVAGLEGEGQLTWYFDPSAFYLQGRMKMKICTWIGGSGFEGGLFIGSNVQKSKAWILQAGGEHFGISDAQIPQTLTGLFGYGQISFSFDWYIFGGGIELYAALGAFSQIPSGMTSAWAISPLLSYVMGSCGIYVEGQILGGLVSASAWAQLTLKGPVPLYFEGNFGLEGCVLWVICASVDVTAGLKDDGFYIE